MAQKQDNSELSGISFDEVIDLPQSFEKMVKLQESTPLTWKGLPSERIQKVITPKKKAK